ncbi:MAG: hypothetical protein ACKPKO_29935, partial [Candidatus Fonsibacter sp.]
MDPGTAGIFLSESTVRRLLRHRKPGKASALIPNAALNAMAMGQAATAQVTWYLELIMVNAEVGTYLPVVQVHHKYKVKSIPPGAVSSYRPLGLAEPLLSILSDVLYMRSNVGVAQYAGRRQQGGQADPRYMAVVQRDARQA